MKRVSFREYIAVSCDNVEQAITYARQVVEHFYNTFEFNRQMSELLQDSLYKLSICERSVYEYSFLRAHFEKAELRKLINVHQYSLLANMNLCSALLREELSRKTEEKERLYLALCFAQECISAYQKCVSVCISLAILKEYSEQRIDLASDAEVLAMKLRAKQALYRKTEEQSFSDNIAYHYSVALRALIY